MRLLWLALLILLSAPGDWPTGVAEPRASGSISAVRATADQPFLPGDAIRSLLGSLQLPGVEGTDEPPGAPQASRLSGTPGASPSSHLTLPPQNPDLVPVRTCERLPYDATAPPAIG